MPAIIPIVAGQGAQGNQNLLQVIVPLLLMVGIFYFLLIRPQQRRVRQQRALVDSLDVGDEVVTIGGMFGRIVRIDDESVTLDIGTGTEVRFVKNAIARKFVLETGSEGAGESS